MPVPTPDGVTLHVAQTGHGAPLLLLSGGPGCVNYLAPVAALLPGWQGILPDPRGVGRSGGGPHGVAQAVQDLETLRDALGVEAWSVLGHSWGADLGLAYALAHPGRVTRLVSFAGTGVQYDRDWKAAYEAGKSSEAHFEVEWNPAVHAALRADWRRYIKAPGLLRALSRLDVPVTFIHPAADIRPGWPAAQLAALLPRAALVEVPGATHHAWLDHAPALQAALTAALDGGRA